ncbi:VacJ family lipoprotein [Massilia sp. MS-15]|uniref:MlaA family lipoprotein n=1 Tax=Massilia sp. MS-15 TaxID=2878200 RepID=UPI001CD32685|nr:VacJ family lipoprotein [Massilia sp. MS-15]MCA1247726.1 VacJ family lipoprotein [Massilia sp. MS-15]
MNHLPYRRMQGLAAIAAALLLTGCATTGNPQDPLEGYNRAMFSFNDAVDRSVLKPTATAYKNVTPSFVQTGVNNFFGNLSDVWSAVNNLLQGKGEAGMGDLSRVTLNTTFGVLGLFDLASEAGLPKHNEDFGQTLGVWGIPSGPFLMLPVLGPSTVRDTAALPADMGGDIWKYKEPANWRNIGAAVRVVDKRASLLDATNLLEDVALDRYEFLRDAYLQRRQSQVYDGDVPRQQEEADAATSNAEPAANPAGKAAVKPGK